MYKHRISLEGLFLAFVVSVLILMGLVTAFGVYAYYSNKHRVNDNKERIDDIARLRFDSRLQTCREINKIRAHLRRTHLHRALNSYQFLTKHPNGLDGFSRSDIEEGIRIEVDEVESFKSIDCLYYAGHIIQPTRYLKVHLPVGLRPYGSDPFHIH